MIMVLHILVCLLRACSLLHEAESPYGHEIVRVASAALHRELDIELQSYTKGLYLKTAPHLSNHKLMLCMCYLVA